jgi:hypothetical protein
MLLLLWSSGVNALTKEQAIEACKQSIGIPYVQSCMRAGGNMAGCRAKVYSTVRDCAISALNKANGRANMAVSIDDKETRKDPVNLGNALTPDDQSRSSIKATGADRSRGDRC